MKSFRNTFLALLATAGIILGLSQTALAVGTAADLSIGNRAVITYTENAATVTVESSESGNANVGAGAGGDTSFTVDTKVDLSMTDATITSISGGTSQAFFTLTNDGNKSQDYALAIQDPGSNSFDATSVKIYLDNGTTALTFDGSDALYLTYVPGSGTTYEPTTYADNNNAVESAVAADGTLKFWVQITAPASVNGQTALYYPVATTLNATTFAVEADDNAAWEQNTADVVLADGSGPADDGSNPDGKISATATCSITGVSLTVTKTVVVISDPYNSADPKAIPGAVMEYTITVANDAGASAATGVELNDTFNTNLTLTVNAYDTGKSVQVAGAAKTADAGDGDGDGVELVAANQIKVTGLTVGAGSSVVVKFQVTIN